MLHHPVRRALRGMAAALTCAAVLAACSGGGGDSAEAVDCSNAPLPPSPTTSTEPQSPASNPVTPASSQAPPAASPAAAPSADDGCDQVTYLTAFKAFGRDAFAWCGVQQGFFADNGIEVEIQLGNGTDDNLAVLLGEQADFVLVDLAGGLLALGKGVDGWKAVGAIHQDDLSTWMTTNPDLQTARDLEGHTIAMPFSGVIPSIFPTYAEFADADIDRIEIVNAAPPQIPGLLAAGQVDAIAQFAVGLPFVQSAVGDREVYVHPISEWITDLYGVGLATTDEKIASDPDLVQRFRDALLRSLDWALAHPEQCAEIYAQHAPQPQPVPVAAAEMQLMVPYVREGTTFGTYDRQRVAQMIATLEGAGAIPPTITPQDIVAFEFAAEDGAEEDQ